ncbi:hypothetical protein OsI_07576 [Oryza sativa Indica Group]|uniref:Uncharacterized protein n=1 Tax=Oryza sativa subsp. indica TaxID=39946 RepID=A2X5U0_ORYSI|nr:hypothetical protein OsI_07576 [Oryza sativa Indica Group]
MAPNEADGAQVSTGGKAPRKQAGAGDTNQPLRHPRLHAKRRHHQCPQGHPARAPHQRLQNSLQFCTIHHLTIARELTIRWHYTDNGSWMCSQCPWYVTIDERYAGEFNLQIANQHNTKWLSLWNLVTAITANR